MNGLLQKTFATFFLPKNGNILSEIICEPTDNCDRNGMLFKGLTVMWLANIALVVNSTYTDILEKIQTTTAGAAKTCTGLNNETCGMRWYGGEFDGQSGFDIDITATTLYSVAMLPFVRDTAKPLTGSSGGNTSADPSAGTETASDGYPTYTPISTADRAGAGILTVIFTGGLVGMAVFMLTGV